MWDYMFRKMFYTGMAFAALALFASCDKKREPRREDFQKKTTPVYVDGQPATLFDFDDDGRVDAIGESRIAGAREIVYVAPAYEDEVAGRTGLSPKTMDPEMRQTATHLKKATEDLNYQVALDKRK